MAYLDVTPTVELFPVPRVVLTVADSVMDNPLAPELSGNVTVPAFPGSTIANWQSHGWDPDSGDLYVAQNIDTVSNDLVIYRCTLVSGVWTAQDSMKLVDGGHGNTIGVENDSGDIWIYNFWRGATPGPTRTKYNGTSAGTTVHKTDSNVETLPDMDNGVAMGYSIDSDNNTIGLWRGSGGAGWESITLRDLTEFKAGTNNILNRITYTPGTGNANSFAGFQIADDYVYVWRGGAYGDGHPYLSRYSWATPDASPMVLDLGALEYDPTNPDGLNEAEGVGLLRDGSGNAVITLGVMTAPSSGVRGRTVWTVPADGIPSLVLGVAATGVERVNADGTVELVRSLRVEQGDGRGQWVDYELPQQEQVTYRAVAPQSTTEPGTASVTMPDVGAWLINPDDPDGSIPITVQQGGFSGWGRPSTVSVTPIAESDIPYVVESSVRQAPTGDISLWVLDSAVHDMLVKILSTPGAKLFSWPRRQWKGYGQIRWAFVTDFTDTPGTSMSVKWGSQLTLQPSGRPAVVNQAAGEMWDDPGTWDEPGTWDDE